MKRALVLAAGLALLAGPVLAQEQPAGSDPIGDVLSGLAAQQGMDDDAAESATATAPEAEAEPDAAAASQANDESAAESADGDAEDPGETAASALEPAPPAYAPPAPAYSAPAPYIPPAPASRLPQLDRPVLVDELSRTPEAPPTAVEQAYESRIRGGLNAAQGLQGPLDGGWVLRGPDGRTLYGLQLVDKGTGAIMLEGAWRSMKPGPGQVGLVDSISRTASGGVDIRFTPRGAREASVLQLEPAGAGWSGTLWEAGANRSVTLRRN
ncbi:MAG: hypothetical protein K0R83_586 [Caulobacter sp.]|jgi:hypothetical protein|nr:hypothetical protein [Caulobacter sp.]